MRKKKSAGRPASHRRKQKPQGVWTDGPSPWWPAWDSSGRVLWGPRLGPHSSPPEIILRQPLLPSRRRRRTRAIATLPRGKQGQNLPNHDERPFLARLRGILTEYRRRGGHSRRLNPRRASMFRVLRSEFASARILSIVDSCIASAGHLPWKRRAVIQQRRSVIAGILTDHLYALHCHPVFLASPGTDRAIAKLKHLVKDLNVGRWRTIKALSRSERAVLGDYRTPEQAVVEPVLDSFLREENLERYGLESEDFMSLRTAHTRLVTRDVRALSQQRVSPRLVSHLFGDLRRAEVELFGRPALVRRVSIANAKKIIQRVQAQHK
jgi:hypothetical protein